MAPFGPPKSIAPTRSPFLECLENWKYYYYYYSKLLILLIFFLSNPVPKTRSSSNPIFTQSSPHPPTKPATPPSALPSAGADAGLLPKKAGYRPCPIRF
jgi:hypothetical protein